MLHIESALNSYQALNCDGSVTGIIEIHTGTHRATPSHTDPEKCFKYAPTHTDPHQPSVALEIHTEPHRATSSHTDPHRATPTQKNALNTHTDPHRATMTQKILLAVF